MSAIQDIINSKENVIAMNTEFGGQSAKACAFAGDMCSKMGAIMKEGPAVEVAMGGKGQHR